MPVDLPLFNSSVKKVAKSAFMYICKHISNKKDIINVLTYLHASMAKNSLKSSVNINDHIENYKSNFLKAYNSDETNWKI